MYIDSSQDRNGTPLFIRILFIFAGALVGFLIFSIFFTSYKVNEDAMNPTLKKGGIIILRKVGAVKPGDIVVVKSPLQKNRIFIRRVIATEGMRVSLKEKKIMVNGSAVNAPLHLSDSRIFSKEVSPRDTMKDLTVPEKYIFIIGDNFDQSYDSRFFGPVNIKSVIGTLIFKF